MYVIDILSICYETALKYPDLDDEMSKLVQVVDWGLFPIQFNSSMPSEAYVIIN